MQTQLATTVGAAQRDALRFAGKLPAKAWRPSPSRRWLRWGVPLCLAGAALLLLCEVLAAPRPLDRAAPAPPLPAPPRFDPSAASAALPESLVTAPAVAVDGVERQPSQRVMAIDSWPLAEAARQLAASTSSTLHGVDALPATRVVRRQWVGVSPAAAWQALLGDVASYALQCTPVRCDVHIVGAAVGWIPSATVAATASIEPIPMQGE